ncbi:hypothetical protein [Phenylobacterium sp. SCN 70-31]|uniref:hypothetical protein n=1 Tax=Phenylobacterium sp. SCN 70-31 TaxID=1660129 RepID=UPI000869E3CD|nr:hypothetical protein [Phenylobacterium sp. SCN 70-31]ODT85941.1 MAG: hypothetical protein ABS78_18565 [Phenylobacterium sp. SCN 70-31]
MPRLFLSVDMAGSTEFKARFTGQGADGWLEVFRTFFSSFPLMLAGQIGFEFLDDDATPSIDVWKVMGDEVVFATEPTGAEELTSILLVLQRTMRMYEARHFEELPLRLKGAAWLADVDGPNIQIEIPELSSKNGAHIDYIGPDIDLGFRISKFSRPGCLTISLDVLETVLGARNAASAAVYIMGREPLKGVLFGRPYPILWMLDAETAFDFLPWEVDADPLMAAALRAEPASIEDLRKMIADMRLYLKRMHGRDWAPVSLT